MERRAIISNVTGAEMAAILAARAANVPQTSITTPSIAFTCLMMLSFMSFSFAKKKDALLASCC